VIVALLFALALGCSSRSPYPCSSSSDCVSHGAAGVCEQGFCAFVDPACADGFRYEPNAGGGLAGTCATTDAGMPNSACGGVGQACCATATACTAGGSCESGTCQACVTEVAVGRRFACVIERDHTVWCSGDNTVGQLGFGIAGVPSATPTQVHDTTSSAITDAIAIGAGRAHACAIRTGGTVWCWGENDNGQIGNATTSPSVLSATQVVKVGSVPLTDIVELSGSYDHTCARDSSGGVWCWGINSGGELGDGTTTGRNTAAPVLVAAGGAPFTGAIAIEMGGKYACARKANGEAWCWGRNDDGQFGDNTRTSRLVPGLLATTSSVGAGMFHACYVNADTTITCAGWNGFARLGLGSGAGYFGGDSLVPTQVLASPGGSPFTGAAKVFAGGESCAIMQDTSVYCWGDSRYGQTGTGQGATVPARVSFEGKPLDQVDRMVAHWSHACAHRMTGGQGGEWLCWGRNSQGELGDGTFVNRGFPTRMKGSCR
jgi:alpha-tubulin suppressor-like RCC1 family protein